jgi:hypothetical protein
MAKLLQPLQLWINIAWTTAFRGVTGYILKLAFLLAARAGIGTHRGCDQKTAITAFPIGESTARAERTAEITG